MTTQTIAVGWLLIGAALATFGIGIIWWVRSEWAERQAVKAERIILPSSLSSLMWERHVADALAKTEAAPAPRLSSVAPVIPIQRRGES